MTTSSRGTSPELQIFGIEAGRSGEGLREGLRDGLLQGGEASGDISAEMHAQRAAVAIR